LLPNRGTNCMQLFTAVVYLQAGRKCSIVRVFIYLKMCRLWMYVPTLMWLMQCNGSKIGRVSVGENSSGFGDSMCLHYQDFFPKRTGLCWMFHGMHICRHTRRFCEKINLTVLANWPVFLSTLRSFLKRKKNYYRSCILLRCYVLSSTQALALHMHTTRTVLYPHVYPTVESRDGLRNFRATYYSNVTDHSFASRF
jgi:hypothetical protein